MSTFDDDNANDALTPLDIIGPEGLIARRVKRYETRQQQLDMVRYVHEAVRIGKHLAVEAGTGVGKSFAYLVPAILHTTRRQNEGIAVEEPNDEDFDGPDFGSGRERVAIPRAVISTHTISLQEQLVAKDIPLLNSVIPLEFSAVLVKGRSNYLCLRRLETVARKATRLFDDAQDRELDRLLAWSKGTADGTKSDLSPVPNAELWDDICCEQGNCLGKTCRFYKDCFYGRARRRLAGAQLLIVNHALLFSDLAIRTQGGSILPPYDLLVFDEAHTMEQVAADHLGIGLSQGQVDYMLNKLHNDRTNRGLLKSTGISGTEPLMQAVDDCRYRSEAFFGDLVDWMLKHPGGTGRVREPNIVKNGLSEGLRSLCRNLRELSERIDDPGERQEFRAARMRLETIADAAESWTRHGEGHSVYWVEHTFGRRTPRIKIASAPIHVGPLLQEFLFDKVPCVVMTSATLSTGANSKPDFTFFKSRIGQPDLRCESLGSPFDYRKQAELVIVKGLLPPNAPENEVRRQLGAMLRRYLTETGGHAFVLFTAYSQMRRLAEDLMPWLSRENMPLFLHGDGTPRSKLLDNFKRSHRGVLFGTDSFWQGVDVPGDALRNVVITKLPFQVPSEPLVEARIEAINEAGGNAFMEYSLPNAILKFKQGFGRLIRTRDDRGIVVVLDPRIYSQRYGQRFIDALPPCTIRTDTATQD